MIFVTTETKKIAFSTCKLIAEVVPGVLSVGLTGGSTVPAQVLLHVPAFSFIEGMEKEGKLPDVWLRLQTCAESAWLADHQRPNQT